MIVYKLFRKLKNGEITSLFINKKERLSYNKWYEAKDYPTKGYAIRPFWHCVGKPEAPHLTTKNRVWLKVEIEDYIEYKRPAHQGCNWYLAKKIRILNNET
jgi:hypothetical protein